MANDAGEILMKCYGKLNRETQFPPWAQKSVDSVGYIPPTIPFVGKNYSSGVLLYASAENLAGYDGYLERDGFDITDRHRFRYNMADNEKVFFPTVHCAPVSNGGLLLAAAYICRKLNLDMDYETPKRFLECIAFGNFCKFSIHTDSANEDYPRDAGKLRASFDYIRADLEILRPKYIIIPKTIYEHAEAAELTERHAAGAKVIPIYQINESVVNRTINRPTRVKKPLGELPPELREWYERLDERKGSEKNWQGRNKDNYRAVFAYIDEEVL